MRKSLRRTTLVLAVVFSISAVSLPGCSTSNAFKMPSSDWLSWGKKKPANTALASKPTNNLPAPPSSLASPNTVPSYAQGSGATSGSYANNPYRGPAASGTPATAASYGTQTGSANPYPNAAYGAAPASVPGAAAANGYGGSSTSQGFYSPDYRGASSPGGASSVYAGQAGSSGPATTPGADAYGAYGQNAYAGMPQGTQGWSQGGAPPPAPYGATGNAYGQAAASPAPASYDPYGNSRGNDGYAGGGAGAYGDANATAGSMPSAPPAYPAAVASGGYRPGSTARSTQFGTSDNLNVPGQSVQPASFAGGGQAGSGSSLAAPSPVGGNSAYEDGAASQTRTATGGDGNYPYPYPNTYQR